MNFKSEADKTSFIKQSGLSEQTLLAITSRNQPRAKLPRASYKVQVAIETLSGHNQNSQTAKKQVKTVAIAKKALQQQVIRPNSPQQFVQMYKKYLTQQCNQTLSETFVQWIQNNKICLYDMLANSLRQEPEGGIIKIIAEGRLKTQFNQFIIALNATSPDQAFEKYKKHLLRYQFYLCNNAIKNKSKIQNLFHSATFVPASDLSQLLDTYPLDLKYYDEDILVLRNGEESLKIDYQTISLDKVAQRYKDFVVDIRIQKPMDYGFNVNKLRNQPFQMKLSDYRKYQKICQDNPNTCFKQSPELVKQLGKLQNISVNGTKFSQRLKKGDIFFAVNFDPSDGILIDHIQQHVKNTFLGYKESFDLLSYLDHEVPGCSLPQFYFKVKGVWTGGHQENINMCAININHGPDSSEWYSMNYQHVQKFRKTLKQKFKIDLYSQQGLWYQKMNWFLENDFPIKKIIQKKGDVVVSGPGTLHWVRSYGIALQSAWNIFPTTLQQFKYALNRHAQNKRLKFIRSNTIPFKSLVLKYLNHQHGHMRQNVESLLIQAVQRWYNQEQQLIKEIRQIYKNEQHVQHQKLQDLQSFCQVCRQQVLMFFVDGAQAGIMCLQCYKEKQNARIKSQNSLKIYSKHYAGSVHSLLQACKGHQQFTQFQEFCNPSYVGRNVNCKLKKQQCKQDHIKENQIKIINLKIQQNLKHNMKVTQEQMELQKKYVKQSQTKIIDKDFQMQGQNLQVSQKQEANQKFKYNQMIDQQLIQNNKDTDNPAKNIKEQLFPNKQIAKLSDIIQTKNDLKRQRESHSQNSRNNSPQFSSSSQHGHQTNKQVKTKPSSQDRIKKKHKCQKQSSSQKQKVTTVHKNVKYTRERSHSNRKSHSRKKSLSSQSSHSKRHKKQRKRQDKHKHDGDNQSQISRKKQSRDRGYDRYNKDHQEDRNYSRDKERYNGREKERRNSRDKDRYNKWDNRLSRNGNNHRGYYNNDKSPRYYDNHEFNRNRDRQKNYRDDRNLEKNKDGDSSYINSNKYHNYNRNYDGSRQYDKLNRNGYDSNYNRNHQRINQQSQGQKQNGQSNKQIQMVYDY